MHRIDERSCIFTDRISHTIKESNDRLEPGIHQLRDSRSHTIGKCNNDINARLDERRHILGNGFQKCRNQLYNPSHNQRNRCNQRNDNLLDNDYDCLGDGRRVLNNDPAKSNNPLGKLGKKQRNRLCELSHNDGESRSRRLSGFSAHGRKQPKSSGQRRNTHTGCQDAGSKDSKHRRQSEHGREEGLQRTGSGCKNSYHTNNSQ